MPVTPKRHGWHRLAWRTATPNGQLRRPPRRAGDGPAYLSGWKTPGELLWLICERRADGREQSYLSNPQRLCASLPLAINTRWASERCPPSPISTVAVEDPAAPAAAAAPSLHGRGVKIRHLPGGPTRVQLPRDSARTPRGDTCEPLARLLPRQRRCARRRSRRRTEREKCESRSNQPSGAALCGSSPRLPRPRLSLIASVLSVRSAARPSRCAG